MPDEVKNAPLLRIGFINEIMSEAIFIMMDQSLRKFFRWTIILFLRREAALRCYT
jgi:hypothetical protein